MQSILACMALSPFVIGAAQPLRLQPSSQWVVELADNSCRLVRTFGDGDQLTKLVLTSMAPGNLSMIVRGNPVYAVAGRAVRTRLLPVEDEPFTGTAEKAEDGQPVVLWIRVPLLQFNEHYPPDSALEVKRPKKPHSSGRPPPIDLAKRATIEADRQALLSKANELEIEAYHPIILEVGSMAAPIAMFDQCDRNLLHELGVDPEVQDRIVRPLWIADMGRWIGSFDYPLSALLAGRQAKVEVRLLVDSAGKVTNCATLTDYNASDFQKAVCNALSRAIFEPAELSDGTKVPSYYTKGVVFQAGR